MASMSKHNCSCSVGASAPSLARQRKCSSCSPRSAALLICIISLLMVESTPTASAFQLQTANSPAQRTVSTSLFANKGEDPTTDLFSGSEKGSSIMDTKSEIDEKSSVTTDSAGFGESVPFVPLAQRNAQVSGTGDSNLFSAASDSSTSNSSEAEILLKQNSMRNIAVAVASFAFAIFNYGWQFSHPVTAIEVLASMEKQSAPLSAIGNNGKPTVIDFWAPWCSNCKVAAPTLQAVEQEYGDRVNFIMVNADTGGNWPLIQYFGVDAIPHLAFLSAEGDVETALIGPTSRNVLRADIDALLHEKGGCEVEVVKVCHDDLPYKMYDAFGNRQDARRVNFAQR